jgi:hypothetical protein
MRKINYAIIRILTLGLIFVSFLIYKSPYFGHVRSTQIDDTFGICNGYSYKLSIEIPTGAIEAIQEYLQNYQPFTISHKASKVDPELESTSPHLCPTTLDQLQIPKNSERVNLVKKNGHIYYAGVVPPGATKALMVAVTHAPKHSDYSGTNPSIMKTIKSNLYTSSNMIVAFYPGKGWVAVYNDPASYGGFHY